MHQKDCRVREVLESQCNTGLLNKLRVCWYLGSCWKQGTIQGSCVHLGEGLVNDLSAVTPLRPRSRLPSAKRGCASPESPTPAVSHFRPLVRPDCKSLTYYYRLVGDTLASSVPQMSSSVHFRARIFNASLAIGSWHQIPS